MLIGVIGMKLFNLQEKVSTSAEKTVSAEKTSSPKASNKKETLAEKPKTNNASVEKTNPEQNITKENFTEDSLVAEEPVEELFYEEDTNNYYDTILSASDSQFISFAKDNFEDTSVAFITIDSSIVNDSITEEPLEVKKEQVLGMITLPIINLDDDTLGNSESDSVISQLSDIKEKEIDNISVAFWSSPINFKGYKFNGNKLILYGLAFQLDAKENARVYQFKNQFFLKYFGTTYRIQNSLQYKTYEEVKDSTLLKVLR